jgi:hypothetical protein
MAPPIKSCHSKAPPTRYRAMMDSLDHRAGYGVSWKNSIPNTITIAVAPTSSMRAHGTKEQTNIVHIAPHATLPRCSPAIPPKLHRHARPHAMITTTLQIGPILCRMNECIGRRRPSEPAPSILGARRRHTSKCGPRRNYLIINRSSSMG